VVNIIVNDLRGEIVDISVPELSPFTFLLILKNFSKNQSLINWL
jgi:hypothetical protein